ncbi:uncharacterized protein LOC136039578 [Artemia franciscana]|uniref:Cuticle protein n=1 Tax=Artemia franciscana TaxID=6661 RepID=A0AA88HXX8_ARTSF|nr:hypothetical protein QYM36_010729 [Artemia franciscana]
MKFIFLVLAVLVAFVSCRPAEEIDIAKSPSYNGPTYNKAPPQGYFQYANAPGPHEYEFGYNRGNKDHSRSHYEQSKDHRFRTRAKWADTHGGYGEHYWEYNHGDYSAPSYHAPKNYDAAPVEAPKY